MIIKGKVIGLGPVNEIKKEDRTTKIRAVTVDVQKKDYVGVNALSCSVFGENCCGFSVGDDVLCEVGNYGRDLLSVVQLSSVLG